MIRRDLVGRKHVAEHGFEAAEGAENVGAHRELLGELLDDRLEFLRRDRPQLGRGLGDDADILRLELREHARGRLPAHGQQQCRDLFRSAQRGNASLLDGSDADLCRHGQASPCPSGPTISVSETPKRELSSSTTTTSPRATTRPLTTTSTGSPTR